MATLAEMQAQMRRPPAFAQSHALELCTARLSAGEVSDFGFCARNDSSREWLSICYESPGEGFEPLASCSIASAAFTALASVLASASGGRMR
jgi:hypothetical protein